MSQSRSAGKLTFFFCAQIICRLKSSRSLNYVSTRRKGVSISILQFRTMLEGYLRQTAAQVRRTQALPERCIMLRSKRQFCPFPTIF